MEKTKQELGEPKRLLGDAAENVQLELLIHPEAWSMTQVAMRASLGNQLLAHAVKLPSANIDKNEWLACQTYDIYNEATIVWRFVRDTCECPRLTAGEFSLVSGGKFQRSARDHVRHILKKCRIVLQDPEIFVCQEGGSFPENFSSFVSHIIIQILQIYCHIYRHHFTLLLQTDSIAHVNSCFKHALYFGFEFSLVKEDDIAPVKKLAMHFLEQANTLNEEIKGNN